MFRRLVVFTSSTRRRQAYRDVEYNTGKHFFVTDLREIY